MSLSCHCLCSHSYILVTIYHCCVKFLQIFLFDSSHRKPNSISVFITVSKEVTILFGIRTQLENCNVTEITVRVLSTLHGQWKSHNSFWIVVADFREVEWSFHTCYRRISYIIKFLSIFDCVQGRILLLKHIPCVLVLTKRYHKNNEWQ